MAKVEACCGLDVVSRSHCRKNASLAHCRRQSCHRQKEGDEKGYELGENDNKEARAIELYPHITHAPSPTPTPHLIPTTRQTRRSTQDTKGKADDVGSWHLN